MKIRRISEWRHELIGMSISRYFPAIGTAGFERVLAADWVEGTGPEAVWRRTEYGELVGESIDCDEVETLNGVRFQPVLLSRG